MSELIEVSLKRPQMQLKTDETSALQTPNSRKTHAEIK